MNTTPKTLNVHDTAKLLNELKHDSGSPKKRNRGIRNHCMALLMLDAGLRVGEVVGQTIDNLYFLNQPRDSLLVSETLSHGNTERRIPLSQRIRNAVEDMHTYYWPPPPGDCFWFAFYQNICMKHLTTRQVERIIRSAAMKSLGRPVHPHILRHTFASRLIRTTNIRIVQELLGHQHITTTQIYTHPNQDDLKTAIVSLETEHETFGVDLDNLPPLSDTPNRPDTTGTDRDMR